ncbi:MAG: DedA family protein [Ideonella sp.]|nr:DedA family protein [Ideonella sp.]MCC7456430.1 DedA family protein [Nitrospira sp.]
MIGIDHATWQAWLHHYGYAVVLLGSLVEGETLLLLGGAAARHGELAWYAVVAVGAFGGWLGDQLLFALGRWRGRAWLHRRPAAQAHAQRVLHWIARHPDTAVVGVRFVYGMRLLGPAVIGMSGVPVARFMVVNALGALVWASLWVTLGGLAQRAAHAWIRSTHPWLLGIAVLVAALAALFAWRSRGS